MLHAHGVSRLVVDKIDGVGGAGKNMRFVIRFAGDPFWNIGAGLNAVGGNQYVAGDDDSFYLAGGRGTVFEGTFSTTGNQEEENTGRHKGKG